MSLRVLGLLLCCAASVLGQGAGSEYPMRRVADMFQPLSRPAEMIHVTAVLVLIICGFIFLVVTGLLVYIVVKFRRPENDDGNEPPQIYGSTNIELAWTVIPILITVVLVLVTSRTIGEIQNAKMPEDALKVRVVGHQWWWEVHYPDLGIITANEIHIPISDRDIDKATPTHFLLQSADVIHSFWVPQLAGKVDVVPNKDNDLWFDPFETGVYFGNCAEYCGTQHANMLLRVIVHTKEGFEKWVANQKAPPPAGHSRGDRGPPSLLCQFLRELPQSGRQRGGRGVRSGPHQADDPPDDRRRRRRRSIGRRSGRGSVIRRS